MQLTLKTDDSNVVTMAYYNRLRVSEHKATSDYPSGGYMQNAEFTYNPDSHPATMAKQHQTGFCAFLRSVGGAAGISMNPSPPICNKW